MLKSQTIFRGGNCPKKAELLGGKGFGLERLTRAGLPVPRWICLTPAFFQDLPREFTESLAGLTPPDGSSNSRYLQEMSIRVGSLIREQGVGACQWEMLRDAVSEHLRGKSFAVRSSALGEDGARASFAGLMDSFLCVPLQDLPERILRCYASAWSARAMAYRLRRGFGITSIESGVVIQEMVDARASGVMFTADPRSGGEDRFVIAAALGLGEGVVADRAQADEYVLQRLDGKVLEMSIAKKKQRISPTDGGTQIEEVPMAVADVPSLGDEELRQLHGLALQVEAALGTGQDIEWSMDHRGELHLLQARPITFLPPGHVRVFDNTNIIESYPGVTTPLTFSFVRGAYEIIFRQSARAFGVPEPVIAREQALFANMVGFLNGRIYYNILNWYRLYGLIPGFEGRLEAWEKSLGLSGRSLKGQARETVTFSWFSQRLAQVRVVIRIIRNFFRLESEIRAFDGRFRQVQEDFQKLDLESCSADDLADLHDSLVQRLLWKWEVTTLNDFYAFNFYDLAERLLQKWGLEGKGVRINDLVGGETGMQSLEPLQSALDLAKSIRASSSLRATLTSDAKPDAIWRDLMSGISPAAFRHALSEHVQRFGDRTLHELKLETPALEDDPSFFIQTLRRYVESPPDLVETLAGERAQRARAEKALRDSLRGHPLRLRILKFALGQARIGLKNRENLRLARSRAFGIVKRIFGAMGAKLARAQALDSPRDIFFLGADEILGFLRGSSMTLDLRALVKIRRAQHTAWKLSDSADRIRTRGIVYGNLLRSRATAESAKPTETAGHDLQGIGASSGRVTAPAAVVIDPESAEPESGAILVAPMTDPGWVFLMVSAAGLVVERGNLLSHTAIIGRELGIPVVIGLSEATKTIRTGQKIEIDGASGTVRILAEPNETSEPKKSTEPG